MTPFHYQGIVTPLLYQGIVTPLFYQGDSDVFNRNAISVLCIGSVTPLIYQGDLTPYHKVTHQAWLGNVTRLKLMLNT